MSTNKVSYEDVSWGRKWSTDYAAATAFSGKIKVVNLHRFSMKTKHVTDGLTMSLNYRNKILGSNNWNLF